MSISRVGQQAILSGVDDGPLKGEDAWRWIIEHEPFQQAMNDNPKWALVPRIEK